MHQTKQQISPRVPRISIPAVLMAPKLPKFVRVKVKADNRDGFQCYYVNAYSTRSIIFTEKMHLALNVEDLGAAEIIDTLRKSALGFFSGQQIISIDTIPGFKPSVKEVAA